MKTKDNTNLSTDPIKKLFITLTIPAVTSQVVNALYNMVDRMFIGRIPVIGDTALTGVGVAFPLIMIISAFAALVSMGGAPRASIMIGKDKKEEANKILGNCFVALIITSIVLTILTITYCEPLLLLFGASSNTIGYSTTYMKTYALGTIFVQLTLGMNAFIAAQGYAKTSMKTVCIGAIANIVLDPILIYGFNLGVKGAALATIISQAISTVYVITFLSSKNSELRLNHRYFKIQPSVLFPSLALGVAPFIMQSTESILVLCFNSQLYKFGGDIAVGAMTIMSSVMQFSMLPLQGLTQGAQPIISFNYGAGKIDRVKEAFKLLLKVCFTYAGIMWLLCMFTPQIFAYIFTPKPELIAYTSWGLRIYMACIFMMGIQIACQQSFIALGNAKVSTFLALLRKIFLLIPLIFILPHFIENKVFAVFLAEPVADFISVMTTVILFTRFFKEIESHKIHA